MQRFPKTSLIKATVVAFFLFSLPLTAGLDFQQVRIGNHTFQVEVVSTTDELSKGLMGRGFLPKHRGMLFIFNRDDIYAFWMKNTLIPLDIIWISAASKLVYIHPNAKPFDETRLTPTVAARYVLEIRGGLADDYGFRVGDEVSFIPTLNVLQKGGRNEKEKR